MWEIPLTLLAGILLGAGGLLIAALARSRLTAMPPAPSLLTLDGAGKALTIATPAATIEAVAELAAIRAEWATYRKQLEAYLEAFQDIEESVERKRRRTAASASRAEAAAPSAAPEPPNLRAIARAQGLPV